MSLRASRPAEPDGVVNVVTGRREDAGAALAAHRNVDKAAFTGSTEVGREIVRAAAGNVKEVTLELGGTSPVVVFSDADLTVAIRGAVSAIFSNAGRVCTAASRLLVARSVYKDIANSVVDVARSLTVAGGFEPEAAMGPLVSQRQLGRVQGYVDSGIREGAEVLGGGRRAHESGWFLHPTAIGDAQPGMALLRDRSLAQLWLQCRSPVSTMLPGRRMPHGTVWRPASGRAT